MTPDAQMTTTMVELADCLVDDFDVVDLPRRSATGAWKPSTCKQQA